MGLSVESLCSLLVCCCEAQGEIASMTRSGKQIVDFGKYKGKTFAQVRAMDDNYWQWALNQDEPHGSLLEFVHYLTSKGGVQSSRQRAAVSPGTKRVSFGKYSGKTFAEVQRTDPDYCEWAVHQRDPRQPGLREFIQFLDSSAQTLAKTRRRARRARSESSLAEA